MAAANRFLDSGFLACANQKFVKQAASAHAGPGRVPPGMNLSVVLSIQEERVVQNDGTVVWRHRWFQLGAAEQKRRLVKKVQVCQLLDGTLRWRYQGRELQWKELPKRPAQSQPPLANATRGGVGAALRPRSARPPLRSASAPPLPHRGKWGHF